MNYMGHELTNKLIKLIMPESKPSKMRTPQGVVTRKSVTNKIKELLTLPTKENKTEQTNKQTKANEIITRKSKNK